VLLAVALAATGGGVDLRADDDGTGYRGRPLAEVLRQFQNAGMDLIFSSAVVPEDLMVDVAPAAFEPRAILAEILPSLGLKARDGPAGSIMIVPAYPEVGNLTGRVLSISGRRPIVGASVRLSDRQATADSDGMFEVRNLPAGTYSVAVTAPGFTEVSVQDVEVRSDADAEIFVELEADPRFVTEVVVTPSRHSVVRQEIASQRTVTNRDVILAPTIGGDITRVVELLPGVTAADNSAAFNVRGSLTRDASLVLDGLELYDPYHLQGFQSPFSVIDSHVVDRIDFMGGGFTADYGDRHGGFVDISTGVPGHTGRGGAVEIGTLNSRFSYWAPASEGSASWLVSARAWYPEDMRDTTEVGNGERIEPRFGDLYAKAAFAISGKHLVSAHALLVYDRLDFLETDEEINEQIDAETKNGYAWLRAESVWSPTLTTGMIFSGGQINRTRNGISAQDDEAIIVKDGRVVDFLGLKFDSTLQLTGTQIFKAGADVRWLSAEYDYANVFTENPSESNLFRLDPAGTSVGLYAAWRARVTPNLATELGVRFDRQSYVDGGRQIGPRFNTVWQPGERTQLRFAVGRYYQSQRIHELQIEDGEMEFFPSEASDQAEMTFQHDLLNGLGVRVDAYYRELSDLRPRYENLFEPIELFPETSMDRIRIAPDEAILTGIETLLHGDSRRPLYWWVSYTLSSAEDVIDGDHIPRSWDQRHAGKFLIGHRWGEHWSLSLAGTVHTGWPTTPVTGEVVIDEDGEIEIEPVLGERNSIRFPTYARLDLKARRSFGLPRGRLWLTLEVVNVTDRDNVCCIDEHEFDLQPDGSVDVHTLYQNWLGITPTFSILWEF
jgi:outer membrane cobalamin receptor